MSFIETIPEENANELLQTIYQADAKNHGYVPNFAKAFSLHPEAYQAWKQLIVAIRSKMRMRRYELITFATAMALNCTY